MSLQETFHRPYRETWEDAEEIRKRMEAQYTSEERELVNEFINDLEVDRKQASEEITSLDTLPADGLDSEALHKKHGLYPGALCSRNKGELEKLHGGRLPFEPMSVLRLHLELCLPSALYSVLPPTNELTDILHQYGNVEHGQSISRDIVIPSDLPLYALHYVLQKAFGWKNEKRHHFFIPLERSRLLCHDNASMWSCMVGLLFRSPMMAAENEFWLDDYNGGSFKNWLRKKYTGPYLSQNHSEALIPCQEQMMQLDMNEEFYVCYDKAPDGTEQPVAIYYKEEDESLFPAKPNGKPYARVKVAKLEALSSVELTRFFKADPLTLIERLPLDSVIAVGHDLLSDSLDGYCEFLKAIHPTLEAMQPAEQKKAKQLQRDKLAWTKSQG